MLFATGAKRSGAIPNEAFEDSSESNDDDDNSGSSSGSSDSDDDFNEDGTKLTNVEEKFVFDII